MALRFPPQLLSIVFYFYSSQFTSFVEIGSYLSLLDLDQMAKEPVCVLVTGAVAQIRYALIPMIVRGVMLGPNQPMILHMLDIPHAAEALNGVKIELADATFPLLKGVVPTTYVEKCTRKDDTERKDVMSINVSIYKSQVSALEKHAIATCKVLVFANPKDTNVLILKG
ncbi:malate dehydrogenase, cytoplasmic-like [Juglans regia]|uniref:malate dehydrogenase n=1 Tax=Juglans regia TaxID=51240 RepID=A0A6P9F797_JUGRE|nr:malate dehydrogenase, cytoplasmic-like [Juglans regia]